MKKRLRKKLRLGQWQDWLFTATWSYDPARVSSPELCDTFSEALESDPWWMIPWMLMDEVEPGKIKFVFGSSGRFSPGYQAQQALRSRLIEDWQRWSRECEFPFELEAGPLQADLSTAAERAPRQANRQRQINARRGIQEFKWESWLGCDGGCACCSR